MTSSKRDIRPGDLVELTPDARITQFTLNMSRVVKVSDQGVSVNRRPFWGSDTPSLLKDEDIAFVWRTVWPTTAVAAPKPTPMKRTLRRPFPIKPEPKAGTQAADVLSAMRAGMVTLRSMARYCGQINETSVSARIRELRSRYGFDIEVTKGLGATRCYHLKENHVA